MAERKKKFDKPLKFKLKTRGTSDAEDQCNAFRDRYQEFYDVFETQCASDPDYKKDFIERANAILEDYNVGDALADSDSSNFGDIVSGIDSA